ncbi:MAG: CRTAC1 family protein [Acidobacteria bacterium]|nr:CRTAC1 family protein [Acidobacteriota bacterium]
MASATIRPFFAAALVAACAGDGSEMVSSTDTGELLTSGDPAVILFEDHAADSGVDFVHWNGAAGRYFLPEIMGAGAALVDIDADGDLDVFLVQGENLEPAGTAARDATRSGDRLFRNELSETGALRFTDVSAEAGFASGGYGMGVAAADMDADGRVDLYVTNIGPNRMWQNLGGGRFEDVTDAAGVADAAWSVPAVFLDADRDGDLDLFVGNYVEFNRGAHTACASAGGGLDYCSPRSFAAVPDRYFRNRGGGRFEEAGSAVGVTGVYGYALGAIALDADADGMLDLYVANDWSANQLWLNRDGRFDEGARLAGVAVNAAGAAEAGMGVDAADFDGDGDEDVIVSHLTGETNTLYRNDGGGMFTDASLVSRLGAPSLPWTGFGAGWIDYDNDGLLDFLVVNGAVRGQGEAGDVGFGQPNQLFRNLGDGRFEDVSAAVGPAFAEPLTSRGAAFGDVDNDGDVDVLVTNNAGPAQLLINLVGQERAWIGLRAVEPGPDRDALGSLVEVRLGAGRSLVRRVRTARSYASSSDPRVIFGLGDAEGVAEVRVRWLGGLEESFGPLPIRRYHTLRRGEGVPVR